MSLMLALVLVTGVVAVQAADDTDTPAVPSFDDGRINAYDAGAPVAIFNTRDEVATVDEDGLATTETVVSGIELLSWSSASESASEVLDVSREAIEDAIASNTASDFTIAEENGYTLNYSQSGWFWVTTPPDAEGKVYTFSWQKDF
ncbi:MAG: hypothetical protein LCI00_33480 [Chloroflexi bacterium]|nr:hypothetical protein [Chloroflexota bacterium]MCC6897071.1 hypothetical protein [Anaerolineae bacterium]